MHNIVDRLTCAYEYIANIKCGVRLVRHAASVSKRETFQDSVQCLFARLL